MVIKFRSMSVGSRNLRERRRACGCFHSCSSSEDGCEECFEDFVEAPDTLGGGGKYGTLAELAKAGMIVVAVGWLNYVV